MKTSFVVTVFAAFAGSAAAQQKCGIAGKITITGSTTVFPVSAGLATEYSKLCPNNNFNTTSTGSGAGANGACAKDGISADIGNMSRDWRTTEATTTDGINYKCVIGDTTREVIQIPVALDGVPIIVGKTSTIWTQCLSKLSAGLTSAEIRWLFSNQTTIAQPPFDDKNAATWKWREICGPIAAIPATQDVKIYAPAAGFGTHDYFKEVMFTGGDTFRNTIKFLPDNSAELRDAVADDPFGIGFLGYSYFSKNTAKLEGLAVDGIKPSDATLLDGTYLPLGRRIYSNFWSGGLSKTACYGHFTFTQTGNGIVEGTGFLPLPTEEWEGLKNRLGSCGPSEAPTFAPTAPKPCARFCFFRPVSSCCNVRRFNQGQCVCTP